MKKNTIYGLSSHPLYGVYNDIIRRCEEPSRKAYPYYGGRGVYMCKEWRDNFIAFYQWPQSLWNK